MKGYIRAYLVLQHGNHLSQSMKRYFDTRTTILAYYERQTGMRRIPYFTFHSMPLTAHSVPSDRHGSVSFDQSTHSIHLQPFDLILGGFL
jgi:hypothetical protein